MQEKLEKEVDLLLNVLHQRTSFCSTNICISRCKREKKNVKRDVTIVTTKFEKCYVD